VTGVRIVGAASPHAGVVAALQADAFPEEPWTEASIAVLLADRAVTGFLACRDDGDPIGFVLVRVAADEAEILSIATRADARRRGVGRRLLDAAGDVAVCNGAVRLLLEVSEQNAAAMRMYRSAGFEPVGRRRHYYGTGRDALILCRTIASCA